MAVEPTFVHDADPVFAMHRQGKIGIQPTVEVADRAALAMAYTPGVARVCSAIAEQPGLASEYTWTGNTVAVVSDDVVRTVACGWWCAAPARRASR